MCQKSSSETIETISDIHTISHSSDDEDTQNHIAPADIHESKTRNSDTIMTEFCKKPPSSSKRKKRQTKHFYSSTHPLLTTDISYIQKIIYRSENTHREESKKRKISLITIPESIVEIEAKWSLN